MRSLCLALVLLVATLAGCSDGDDGSAVAGSSAASHDGNTLEVDCGGIIFDLEQLRSAPSVESLAEGPADAVDDAGSPAFDPTQDWKVVHQSDERVDLVRKLDQPIDHGGGDVRTHESRTLEKISGASNVRDGTWLLMQAGPCTPRLVTDSDLAPADLSLPAEPAAEASSFDILVHERACASGQSAQGRIEVVELEETEDQVRLRIGVERREGDQTCQGSPPTQFRIELREPLGAREIVDASIVPPRSVTT